MERVSITFGGGVLVVKDESGEQIACDRATVHLVRGNRSAVAQIETDGRRVELPVASLEIASPVAVYVNAEERPRRRRPAHG